MEKLNELCKLLKHYKDKELFVKNERIAIEQDIANLFPEKLEGSTSQKTETYKITVTNKLRRELDYDKYCKMYLLPEQQFVKLVPKINIRILRYVEKIMPDVVADCITTSSAKPHIKIEEIV